MAYATHDDVFSRFPPITTMVGTGDLDVSTVAVDSIYISDAESYINAFLRGRYQTPLAPEPIITQIATDIAIYRMIEQNAPRIPDIADKRWSAANSTLMMLRDGIMLLDPASQTLISTGGDQEVWSSNLEQSGPVFAAIEANSFFSPRSLDDFY